MQKLDTFATLFTLVLSCGGFIFVSFEAGEVISTKNVTSLIKGNVESVFLMHLLALGVCFSLIAIISSHILVLKRHISRLTIVNQEYSQFRE